MSAKDLWQTIVRSVQKAVDHWGQSRRLLGEYQRNGRVVPSQPTIYRPLKRVRLTDEVSRTLFHEFVEHRKGRRGQEEIGWVLLGVREEEEALILATLPAGADRNASRVHVRFNTTAQALGARIVRQWNRQLLMLGVVHTHPGRLRHPSHGDLEGDRLWVKHLRGREGVFAIGTADADKAPRTEIAWQPTRHMQCWDDLRFTWYSLREGENRYQQLPVDLTLGPDLADPLREVWDLIESHAEELDRLARQQSQLHFEVVPGVHRHVLAMTIPLSEPATELQVHIEGDEVRYVFVRDGEPLLADLTEPRIDRGVYLLLAELARAS